MAIASITQWLEDPDKSYTHGRALYEQYGENRVILTLIKSGSGPYHFNKLRAGLEEVNKKSNLVPKSIVIGDLDKNKPPVPGKPQINYDSAPDKILHIRDDKNQRYAQARKLHETIRVLDSADLRLQAALELLDHMDFVNDCWQVIDDWTVSGKVREIAKKETETKIDTLNLTDLIKESKNLPSYITKAKISCKKAKTPAAQVKAASRLELLENRLAFVKERLAKELEK